MLIVEKKQFAYLVVTLGLELCFVIFTRVINRGGADWQDRRKLGELSVFFTCFKLFFQSFLGGFLCFVATPKK